jgi:predicted lipoprotein with Yx(FWY)xxD motif
MAMRRMVFSALAAGVCALSVGVGSAASGAESYGPFKAEKTKMGEVLATSHGMTLYTFDKDMDGKSACTGKCAGYWPPAMAMASDKATGELTIIKRPDGSMQWAYDGKPLYRFEQDKKAGETMGNGKNGAWHVVKLSE